ncbi:MAG: type II toxin-antitoxin system PemK/MazF family toxin [Patescibacteria group bacterium]|jgi:mRNA interferase MazF
MPLNNEEKAKLIFEWHKIKVDIQLADVKNNLYFYEKDIWWASLGANIGHEEDGKNKRFERPVLILKKFNKHLILIIPLSSQIKKNKFYYYKFSSNNKKFISAMFCQIRLISNKRLIRKMGTINNNDFNEIKSRIKDII